MSLFIYDNSANKFGFKDPKMLTTSAQYILRTPEIMTMFTKSLKLSSSSTTPTSRISPPLASLSRSFIRRTSWLLVWCTSCTFWWSRSSWRTRSVFIFLLLQYIWAVAWDFQQFDILTSVDSEEPVQPPFKLRTSKRCSVSSLTLIEYSSDKQRLWSDCIYAQADLSLCWSHIPHCWKSHALAHIICLIWFFTSHQQSFS